jgi:hypothetical protein
LIKLFSGKKWNLQSWDYSLPSTGLSRFLNYKTSD